MTNKEIFSPILECNIENRFFYELKSSLVNLLITEFHLETGVRNVAAMLSQVVDAAWTLNETGRLNLKDFHGLDILDELLATQQMFSGFLIACAAHQGSDSVFISADDVSALNALDDVIRNLVTNAAGQKEIKADKEEANV